MAPDTKAARQAQSLDTGGNRPDRIPVMPAMRPLKAMRRTAERPISTPPSSALMGVKSVIDPNFAGGDTKDPIERTEAHDGGGNQHEADQRGAPLQQRGPRQAQTGNKSRNGQGKAQHDTDDAICRADICVHLNLLEIGRQNSDKLIVVSSYIREF